MEIITIIMNYDIRISWFCLSTTITMTTINNHQDQDGDDDDDDPDDDDDDDPDDHLHLKCQTLSFLPVDRNNKGNVSSRPVGKL